MEPNHYPKQTSISGQSLLEVILAMAIFGLIAASISSLVAGSFSGLSRGGDYTQAYAILQEGIEAAKSIRDRAWNENIYNQSGATASGNEWVYMGEGTTETIGKFTRTINFNPICRDSSENIAACPASYLDVHAKEIEVTVDWVNLSGKTNSIHLSSYLTNWDSQDWSEDTLVDFNDGTFNQSEASSSLGDGDGAVTLQAQRP